MANVDENAMALSLAHQQLDDPEKMTSPYSLYAPLKSWQTRIFELHPGREGDTLQGELFVADMVQMEGVVLHDKPELIQYDAISYAWGAPTFTCSIEVNGRGCAITPTLDAALKRFRNKDRLCYLWVDALCINQADDGEKSTQVRQMFTIFSKAQSVLVWLGEATAATAQGLEHLTDSGDVNASGSIPPISPLSLEALFELSTFSWYHRVWVQQEIFAARTVIFQCGRTQFSMATLKKFAGLSKTLNSIGTSHEKLLKSTPHEKRLKRFQDSVSNLRQASSNQSFGRLNLRHIETVMANAQSLEATDPRDRIYAMLSMSTCKVSAIPDAPPANGSTPVPALVVDSNRSLAVVFQDLTKYIINRDRDLLTMANMGGQRHAQREALGLPSWTTDWSHVRNKSAPPLKSPLNGRLTVPWQDSQDTGVLRLHGLIAGTIPTKVPLSKRAAKDYTHWSLAVTADMTMEYEVELVSASESSAKPVQNAPSHEPASMPRMRSKPLVSSGGPLSKLAVLLDCEAELGDLVVFLDASMLPTILRRHDDSSLSFVGMVMYMSSRQFDGPWYGSGKFLDDHGQTYETFSLLAEEVVRRRLGKIEAVVLR